MNDDDIDIKNPRQLQQPHLEVQHREHHQEKDQRHSDHLAADDDLDDDDNTNEDDEHDIRQRIRELSKRIDNDLFLEEEDDDNNIDRNHCQSKKTTTTTSTTDPKQQQQQRSVTEQPSTPTPSSSSPPPTRTKKSATMTTTSVATHDIDPNSWRGRTRRVLLCQLGWDHDTFVWSLRLSIGLTIASLFVLVQPAGYVYPEGIWVFITVAVVNSNPRTDVATVFKTCYRRIQGTTYSSALGLLVGYMSFVIYESTDNDRTAQAIFMCVAVAVYGFVHSYVIDRIGLRNSYSTTLAGFTFGVSLFGFLNHGRPWLSGTMRVVNIFIGITLSCVIAVTVFPFPTQTMVQQNVRSLSN